MVNSSLLELSSIGKPDEDVETGGNISNYKSGDDDDDDDDDINKRIADISVGGMTCSMCSSAIHKLLTGIPGISYVSVSLATNIARVEYIESDTLTAPIIADEIEAIGYDVNDIIIVVSKNKKQGKSSSKPSTHVAVVDISIGGMTCSMCSSAIQKLLDDMDGITYAQVSLATNSARIEFLEGHFCESSDIILTAQTIADEIECIGYDVNDIIPISTSNSTTEGDDDDESQPYRDNDDDDGEPDESQGDNRLQRILKQQDIQLHKRRNAFLWAFTGTVPITTITMIIPHLFLVDSTIRQFLNSELELFFGSVTIVTQALLLWLLATPVQFGCGFTFYKTSYHGIRRGILGMDVLVSIGTTSSYLYAFICMFFSGHNTHDQGYRFFETSAVLITFVLLGKWMNAAAVRQTSQALTQLMKMQPKQAIKIIPCQSLKAENKKWNPTLPYSESIVSISKIKPNDIVKIIRGGNIPADGIVLFGELTVDQSMITGESIPVHKIVGDNVVGGTVCEESTGNACFVLVKGVGADSALSQIVTMVQDAQSKQVPIQNYADSIASIFVPAVLCISILSFITWYACCQFGIVPTNWYSMAGGMHNDGDDTDTTMDHHGDHEATNGSPVAFSLLFGIATLVISCPCALGLATPTAVMVGTGVGARHGILMKGGETLEAGSKVNVVVFDKTGTLTKGKPAVTNFYRLNDGEDMLLTLIDQNLSLSATEDRMNTTAGDYLLWLLGSLERNSEHILATAIVEYAEQRLGNTAGVLPLAEPSDFVAVTGRGASGRIHNGVSVRIGNRAFLESFDMVITEEAEQLMEQLECVGKTAICASVNNTVCAILGIADEIKTESPDTIQYLTHTMGIDVWMVTGDSSRTAHAIAKQLNLPEDRVIAEALPIKKLDHVRTLQQQTPRDKSKKNIIAMVGDGINDSPALVEADVGISMGTGSDIAAEASDMVLAGGNISGVCTVLHLSRTIFRRIQFNLFFSLIYNVVGIPIAAGVLYPIWHTRLPPTLAAVAMAFSSISVVASSLALRFYRPPDITTKDIQTKRRRIVPESTIQLASQLVGVPGRKQKYDKVALTSDSDDEDRFIDEGRFV